MSLVQRTWRIPSQRCLYAVVRLIDAGDIFAFGNSLLAHMAPDNPASTRPHLCLEDAVHELVFDLKQGVMSSYVDIFLHHWSTWQPLLQRVHTLSWAPNSSSFSELDFTLASIVAKVAPPSLTTVRVFVRPPSHMLHVRSFSLSLCLDGGRRYGHDLLRRRSPQFHSSLHSDSLRPDLVFHKPLPSIRPLDRPSRNSCSDRSRNTLPS
jgi:hypothetical protein